MTNVSIAKGKSVTTIKSKPTVKVEMTVQEALAVYGALGKIGGLASATSRKYTDRVARRLEDALLPKRVFEVQRPAHEAFAGRLDGLGGPALAAFESLAASVERDNTVTDTVPSNVVADAQKASAFVHDPFLCP